MKARKSVLETLRETYHDEPFFSSQREAFHEQCIGRIPCEAPEKTDAIVVDLVDQGVHIFALM